MVLVLPAHLTLTKQIKVPRIEPAKRQKIIRFQAEQAIPNALSEVVWDFALSGQSEAEEEIMVVAAKLEIIEQACALAQTAGFTPHRILPSSLATLAWYELVQPAKAQPTLVLNLGARSTTLLQVEEKRYTARTVAIGGSSITQQLAENQDCDLDEAERIKLSERSADLVAEARDALAIRLGQEISRSVMHFARQTGMANPERVCLTGGGASLPRLDEMLAANLKIPVSSMAAFMVVEFAPGTEAVANITDLIGAAAIELLPHRSTMNLLPPRFHQQENQRRSHPWLIAAAVLVVAALVPPIIHFRQVAATARAKIAALEEALAPRRAHAARNRENLARLELLKTQVAQLHSIHDRRASWLRLFTGLQERLVHVEDVWLEKLQTIPPADGLPMKLLISGRMLDKTNPLSKVSPETFTRVNDLLTGIVDLPSVSAVESQRFDNSQPGILKFDFVLVTDPAHPL